jgi:hypothetical protein
MGRMTYIFLLLVLVFAWAEAKKDARLIREGKWINHTGSWQARAFAVSMGSFIMPLFMGPISEQVVLYPWKTVALLCIASGALFSLAFRVFLNRRRGLDWRYVAPWSSWYDRVWYTILYWLNEIRYRRKYWAVSRTMLEQVRDDYQGRTMLIAQEYAEIYVHRAGLLASIVELTAAAVAMILL